MELLRSEFFEVNDLVRYADGVTAIFKITSVHDQGGGHVRYYGEHVLGGACGAQHSDCRPASDADIAEWIKRHPLQPVVRNSMTFQKFSALNHARCRDGFNHNLSDWSPSDWMTATMGELGEAANVVKKLNRVRDGINGNKETEDALRAKLAAEIADTFIYLDLMAQALGIDLESAVTRTFDAKSKEIGYPHLIDRDAA